MRYIILILLFISNFSYAQNFSYAGRVYGINNVGVPDVKIQLWKRVTPTLTGFTSQTNYNNHSYYRSTGTAVWTTAQTSCESMGGHLVTMSNAAENTFVYNTWPSGWIGYYQDKTGAFYSEPYGGWRWTQPYPITNQKADYDVASYTSGNTLVDIKGSVNATLYNTPVYTSTAGSYLTFNGTNQYAITNNLASKVPGKTTTLLAWIYPTGNGVIITELGSGSTSSGWHDSQIEITGGNTLRVAVWNMSGNLSTSITLNAWHLVGFTYDGTTLTGYKDGVSFGTSTVSRQDPISNGNGLYYGIGLTETTNLGSGAYGSFRLADFQVYSAAMSADEIDQAYVSSSWRFGIYPYSNWNGGEPNNSGSEDYTQFVSGGKWNDLNNNSAYQYVLEFDYIITTGPWTLDTTVKTNSVGDYSFLRASNPSIEWKIVLDTLSISPPEKINAVDNNGLILSKRSILGKDYFRYDLNIDGIFSISDLYLQLQKKNSASWLMSTYKIITQTENATIQTATSDLRLSILGNQNYSLNPLTNGGVTNIYIIRTGYEN